MKAIILAGGFGTRLKHVLPDIPKPMADINGRPFLAVLMEYLTRQGFTEFVLSVHHLRGHIIDYFRGMPNVRFAVEEQPLGTGGAIVHSMRDLTGDVMVFNGDTFLEIDFPAFLARHHGAFTVALRQVEDTSRYGRVEVDGSRIRQFREKGIGGPGLINGGTYVINCEWLRAQNMPPSFSFETDLMVHHHPHYYVTEGYFIDIGIPEDYQRACHDLA